MSPRDSWIEGFTREVDGALARLKAPRPNPAEELPVEGALVAGEGPSALSPGFVERLDLSRLELAVGEMQRRIGAQGRRLEAEARARAALEDRISGLKAQLREGEERTAALSRDAAARAAHVQELEQTLELALRARAKLSEVLKEERANAEHWRAQAQALKARLDTVWPSLEKKEKELAETLARYQDVCRTIKEESGHRLKEARLLTSEVEKAKAREAELQAQADAARRALEGERSLLHAQAAKAMENAEAIRRDAVRALEEARDMKASPSASPAAAERRALESELENLRRERSLLAAEKQALTEASPQGKSRRPSGRFLVLAGFVAVAAVSAFLAQRKSKSHPVPFAHPTALVWQGDTLWASDWYDESIYRMRLENGALELVRRYPLPGLHIAGLAVAGDSLYLVDSWTREIQRRKLDDALTPDGTVRSPGTSPSALYFDGKKLWSADNSGALYEHALDGTLTVEASYPGTVPPVALGGDADRLWLAEGRTRLFHARRRDKALAAGGTFGLRELDEGAAPLSCFALRQGKIWIGRDGSKFLTELPWTRLSPRPSP